MGAKMKAMAALAVALAVAACGRDGDGGGARCTEWPDEATYACMCSVNSQERVNSDGSELEEFPGECNDAAYLPDTLCCASPGWGSDVTTAEECLCSALRCGDDEFGTCTCTFNPYSDIEIGAAFCAPPVGGTCCLDEALGFCDCRTDATCFGSEIQVPECNADVLASCDTYVQVDDCAPPDDGGGIGLGDDGPGDDDGPVPP